MKEFGHVFFLDIYICGLGLFSGQMHVFTHFILSIVRLHAGGTSREVIRLFSTLWYL